MQVGREKELQDMVTIDKDEVLEAWECLFSVKNDSLEETIAVSLGLVIFVYKEQIYISI